jgi:hypothetical protein
MGAFGADANGEVTSGMNHKDESTEAAPRDGTPRSSEEVGENRRSQGGVCSEATSVGPTRKGRSLKDEAKPFCISRWEVWEAYLEVKSNKGAAGLDAQSIEEFERDLKKNLYRIWNRMSSGSYFPPPVRTVKLAVAFPTAVHRAWKSQTARFPHSHSADELYLSTGTFLKRRNEGHF